MFMWFKQMEIYGKFLDFQQMVIIKWLAYMNQKLLNYKKFMMIMKCKKSF